MTWKFLCHGTPITFIIANIAISLVHVQLYYSFVMLTESEPIVNGPIRLVNGSSIYEGRVEILVNGQWGTICDDYWSNTDASVVCRHLGFAADGAIARQQAAFGQGTGPIVLDDVQCDGTELTLTDCPSNKVFVHNCRHNEDAGVHCLGE